MCNTISKIYGLDFSRFYFNGYFCVYCVPWLLPPGGSDNVILFLRINILTGMRFFRKGWKVVDFFSFFSCVGNCPLPAAKMPWLWLI